jgi:hypothetical protein
MGRQLAQAVAGEAAESLAIPVTPIPRVPLHRFWRIGVATRMAGSRLLSQMRGDA